MSKVKRSKCAQIACYVDVPCKYEAVAMYTKYLLSNRSSKSAKVKIIISRSKVERSKYPYNARFHVRLIFPENRKWVAYIVFGPRNGCNKIFKVKVIISIMRQLTFIICE